MDRRKCLEIRVHFTLSRGQTELTGIQYEPWHIRYVGLPHSAIMKEKNFVLEEYMDYLKEEKTISVSVNGENMRSFIILLLKIPPFMCRLIFVMRYQETI